MWFKVFETTVQQQYTPQILTHLFRSSILVVNAALNPDAPFPLGRRTYKYAGLLFPVFSLSGPGVTDDNPRRLYLGNHQISFNNPLKYDYNLRLVIHPWVMQLTLDFWESNEEPIFDINTELAFLQSTVDRIEHKIDSVQTNQ